MSHDDERILARGVSAEIFKATGVRPRKHSFWPAFCSYVLASMVLALLTALVFAHN